MSTIYRGRCWKFGDDVLNDGHIMSIEQVKAKETDPAILARYCMVGLDPNFASKAKPQDIIVGGKSFGTGQLHMQGPLSIKGLGLAVVTESMTRSFFRLMITAGVPMLSFVPGVTRAVESGDELEVDFSAGRVRNLSQGTEIGGEPLAPFLLDIIAAGGELAWIKRQRTA